MRFPVNLNDNAAISAVEIYNVIADYLLPVKVVVFKLPLIDLLPQQDLAKIASAAQGFGAGQQLRVVWEGEESVNLPRNNHPVRFASTPPRRGIIVLISKMAGC